SCAPPPIAPATLSLHDALPISEEDFSAEYGHTRTRSDDPGADDEYGYEDDYADEYEDATEQEAPAQGRGRGRRGRRAGKAPGKEIGEHTSELQSRFDLVCRLLL